MSCTSYTTDLEHGRGPMRRIPNYALVQDTRKYNRHKRLDDISHTHANLRKEMWNDATSGTMALGSLYAYERGITRRVVKFARAMGLQQSWLLEASVGAHATRLIYRICYHIAPVFHQKPLAF